MWKNKNLVYPNYNDCIVNLACSIRKYFWLSYTNNTLNDIDVLLESKQPKNVVVILYDGMWANLIKRIIPGSFLSKNMIRSFSSVAPATTTASTISMLTWLYPKEHGWLWWDLYIEPENKIVSLFTNELKDTNIQAQDYYVAMKYYPYQTITDELNQNGEYSGMYISPFGDIKYENLQDMTDKIYNCCEEKGKKYIYAYYSEPDSTMHELWTDSEEAKELFENINSKTEELCKKLNDDSIVIVIADHGHLNCEWILLDNYPDFKNTLDGNIWIEGKLCTFKVKDETTFKDLFQKYFSKDFLLYTKDEVINMNLFGLGNEHELFRKSLGDYFALWYTDKYFRYSEASPDLKSMHSWFTEDEMLIPLIIYHK